MKTIPQINAQYASIKEILDGALAHSGGTFQAESYGAAVKFRQKAYAFRKAYREACAPAASPYEALTLRNINPGETLVRIEPQSIKGTFVPGDGPPLSAPTPEIPEDDELLATARALRENLDL